MPIDTIKAEIAKIIEEVKTAMGDGKLTLAEGWALIVRSVGAFMAIIKSLDPLIESGQLRELVIQASTDFYEKVVKPMDIPGIPNIIETTIVDPMIGKAVPAIIGAVYDTILIAINSVLKPEDGVLFGADGSKADCPVDLLLGNLKKA